jgi:hypothetical protein
MTTITNFV